jgi:hypothetical protein
MLPDNMVCMTVFMCHGCGTQYDDRSAPPPACAICTDDRQYVEWSGQAWITHEQLATDHTVRIEQDDNLLGVGVSPPFAIPQRALHVATDAGMILWDCTSLVTEAAVEALSARGGIDRIVISHPHFYSSMVEWSDAFGGVPILLHAADREWVQRTSPHVTHWEGDHLALSPTVTLYHCPGHFPGSTLLHWSAGPGGQRIVLAGDTLHVAQDRRHVSFVHSVPNHLPMHPDLVTGIRQRLDGVQFDDLYGFTWGLNIIGGAREAVDRSVARHLTAVGR